MNINKLLHGPNVSGQSLVDRVTAAKHSLAGERLAKFVCKATTEEQIPPKKKHIDRLIRWSHDPNVSVPQMAGLLMERAQNDSWIVVFKSLIATHTLMNYGNERFIQFLASNNCTFHLDNFNDVVYEHGYDMSPCIRRYSKYLNIKALSYRQMAYDFCKIKKGKEDGVLRTMDAEFLLKALPVLQAQVDALLEFDAQKSQLTNSVINASFLMLFKDLIRLLACYNDAIINMLARYFSMSRKQCKESLELYKKFVLRMELVAKFLAVAESVGIDKGDIPDLAKAPSSLLDALESHLKSLETGRKSSRSGPAYPELSAVTKTCIASLSNQNIFTLDETAALPPTNPFADLLEASTASATPTDVMDDDIDDVILQSASAAHNPFLSSLDVAAAAVTHDDPWVNHNNIEKVGGFATTEQFEAAFGQTTTDCNDNTGENITDNANDTELTMTSNVTRHRISLTNHGAESSAGVDETGSDQRSSTTSSAKVTEDATCKDADAGEVVSDDAAPPLPNPDTSAHDDDDGDDAGYVDLR